MEPNNIDLAFAKPITRDIYKHVIQLLDQEQKQVTA